LHLVLKFKKNRSIGQCVTTHPPKYLLTEILFIVDAVGLASKFDLLSLLKVKTNWIWKVDFKKV